MADNGRLPESMLADIPGGRLADDGAAAAWLAGPAKAGLHPLGDQSSYRDYEGQLYFWNLYLSGRGNLAARPGTSNHGWGHAVDLAEPWMREWIDRHGAAYGWVKVEAPGEWWHVNYVGHPKWDGKKAFEPLRRGDRGPRVVQLQKLLRHTGGVQKKRRPFRYWPRRRRYSGKFDWLTERRVKRFQRDRGMEVDGVVGPVTWRRLVRLGRKDVR